MFPQPADHDNAAPTSSTGSATVQTTGSGFPAETTTTMRHEQAWQDAQRIETLVPAIYACISGAAGAPRDWDRFRALHRPDSRSLRTVIDADGKPRAESFGQVAHVWSRYDARPAPDSPVLLKRGANSIQLFHDGERWWVVGTIWDNEREGLRFDLF
jgi:hypothetical protein